MLKISILGETIGHIGNYPLTNSILTTWVVMALLIIFAFWIRRQINLVPTNFVSVVEIGISGLYTTFESLLGSKIKQLFPLLASFFVFIWINNLFGILPGVGSIGVKEHEELVPIFRSANADLNTTLALAFISIVAIQYFGIKAIGVKSHLRKYFNFKSPIDFYVGILELISELSRIISFAFRLFGNIFAGEVLLTVIAFLVPYIIPIPFLGLEVFVGFIQALVFSMLTAGFLSVAMASHE